MGRREDEELVDWQRGERRFDHLRFTLLGGIGENW